MYVGQTVDADARRVQHQKDGRDWDEEWLLVIPDYWPSAHRKSWMVCIEEAMIERLSPPYNYRRVGSACILYPAVMSHIANRGFALPGGITVGERLVRLVQGPSMTVARFMAQGMTLEQARQAKTDDQRPTVAGG